MLESDMTKLVRDIKTASYDRVKERSTIEQLRSIVQNAHETEAKFKPRMAEWPNSAHSADEVSCPSS